MKRAKWRMFAFALSWQAAYLAADPLDQWQWRNPQPNGNVLSAITYVSGEFVAVGVEGGVATSSNGLSWMEEGIGPVYGPSAYYTLNGITVGNPALVAVGYGYQFGSGQFGAILSSQDGDTWTTSPCPDAIKRINRVIYAKGLFVAVGGGLDPVAGTPVGAIVTSPDGTNWAVQQSGITDELQAIAYGNGAYVAVSGGGEAISSNDGTNWTVGTLSSAGFFSDITYGNGIFVAVGANAVFTSADGLSWTNNLAAPHPLSSVSYAEGTFVGVGDGGAIVTSADGVRWRTRSSGTQASLYSLAQGGSTWVALGTGTLLVSTNLSNWDDLKHGVTTDFLGCAAYGDGVFVAGGSSGRLVVSADGVRWSAISCGLAGSVQTMTFANGLFVAGDDQGAISISTNGFAWTRQVSGVSLGLFDGTYGGGQFMLVGAGGVILTSTNGTCWEPVDSAVTSDLRSVAYGGGTFLVGTSGGTILSSADGKQWFAASSGAATTLSGMARGNGVFAAVGVGTILTSPDGATWTPANTFTGASLSAVRFSHGTFVAVGLGGTILTSTNGLDWTSHESSTLNYLAAVAYGQGTFVCAGGDGTILQSGQMSLNSLRLGPVTSMPGKTVAIFAEGFPSYTWTMQVSSNLLDWEPFTEFVSSNATTSFIDYQATNYNVRFYRGKEW